MSHLLDRPVWSALRTCHATLARGDDRALRYDPSIVPFAASADDAPDSLRALAALVGPEDTVLLAQADDIVLPAGFAPVSAAVGVQMVAQTRLPPIEDARIEPLSGADSAEMLALAVLTKPGPFGLRAQSLGRFWGIRIDGRLAAMAGERMKQPGHAELSGVCVHPDFRGRGLARLLSLHVANLIFARGETPYLHAYAANTAAIRLYETIGFRLRCRINVMAARRSG